MPIVLPEGLPAVEALRSEGIDVTTRPLSGTERSGPLRVVLLNLMPDKVVTEIQIARLLGASRFQVDLSLVLPDSCAPRHSSQRYLSRFYRRWSRVRSRRFDSLIITGAPVEHLPFERVSYWSEMREILDWSKRRVHRSLFICWAAQAALYHFYGVPKRSLGEKAFGVFQQRVMDLEAPVMRGLGPGFPVPVSRHTEVAAEDLPTDANLRILARSGESGLCVLEDAARHACFMFNHLEYDSDSLHLEYARDLARGISRTRPFGYFPNDDPQCEPLNRWRFPALRFFRNWADEIAKAARAAKVRWAGKLPRVAGNAGQRSVTAGD